MTEPAPQLPIVDPGNQLITPVPANLTVFAAPATGPGGGQMVGLTIRTVDTTLTVLMPREPALEWARLIRQQAQALSGLIVPNGHIPDPGQLRNPGLGGV